MGLVESEIAVKLGNQPNKCDDTALHGRLAIVAIRTHERSTIHEPPRSPNADEARAQLPLADQFAQRSTTFTSTGPAGGCRRYWL